jgi:hypothetical protein
MMALSHYTLELRGSLGEWAADGRFLKKRIFENRHSRLAMGRARFSSREGRRKRRKVELISRLRQKRVHHAVTDDSDPGRGAVCGSRGRRTYTFAHGERKKHGFRGQTIALDACALGEMRIPSPLALALAWIE